MSAARSQIMRLGFIGLHANKGKLCSSPEGDGDAPATVSFQLPLWRTDTANDVTHGRIKDYSRVLERQMNL